MGVILLDLRATPGATPRDCPLDGAASVTLRRLNATKPATKPFRPAQIRAITLDLDDTLWPVWPAIERAEAALQAWLRQHAPNTAARFDLAATREVREAVAREHPGLAHDLGALRLAAIGRMLQTAGDPPSLAAPAFEAFFAARQQVELYADALPALERLAARWPLLALSNGNADIARIGLSPWFRGSLAAHEAGVGKPDPRIFQMACERLGCLPHEVLHIGDDLALDVHGALGAGMHAAWIHRRPSSPQDAAPPCWRGADLSMLVQALGA